MAEPHRQPAPRLTPGGTGAEAPRPEAADLGPLSAAPERFGLFAALRLIEAAHPEWPKLGEARRARDEMPCTASACRATCGSAAPA